MDIILIVFFSYLIGSIPFGLVLTKIFTSKDIRKIGSGNIGATNVLRSGNKYLAFFTLILDSLKGFIPVFFCQQNFQEYVQISFLIVFLGHVFPFWLKFSGGKGVATYLGALFALSYELGLLFIFTWIVVLLIFKYSSLSSIFSSLTVLVITIFRTNIIEIIKPDLIINLNFTMLLFILFILILFTHRKNIINLKNKTEQKIKL